jgi:AcrR family transcriptional regulator
MRVRLLDAARLVFSRRGVEAATIGEITTQADVAAGSFYNYFSSKDEVVEVLMAEAFEARGRLLDGVIAELDDPAEAVSLALRYLAEVARHDRIWARLLVHLDVSHRVLELTFGPRARRDVRWGVDLGRFAVGDVDVAVWLMGGAMLGVVHSLVEEDAPNDIGQRLAEGVLRMLGVSVPDAAEVVQRPLPSELR